MIHVAVHRFVQFFKNNILQGSAATPFRYGETVLPITGLKLFLIFIFYFIISIIYVSILAFCQVLLNEHDDDDDGSLGYFLWQIFSRVYQWKNFENRSQFGKDMMNNARVWVFGTRSYTSAQTRCLSDSSLGQPRPDRRSHRVGDENFLAGKSVKS